MTSLSMEKSVSAITPRSAASGVTVHQIINDIDVAHGGAEKIARMLHDGLMSHGVHSRLLSIAESPSEGVENYESFEYDTPYRWRAIWRLVGYIRKNCGPDDIIHAHLFPTMLWVSLAVRLAGWRGRLVCTEHSTSNRRRGTVKGSIIDALLYSRFQMVACISDGTRDALVGWKPGLTSKLVVIENGAELPFDRPFDRPERQRPVVLSVGRLERPKNYARAIKAVAELKDIDFEYHIAGSGSEEASLKKLTAALGLDDRVRFLGFVEDVPELLKEADIFLMPSIWEGFGLAAVEAMNAGLPVVAGRVAGLQEIVVGREICGELVDPENVASIALGLRTLLSDRSKRIAYGQNAFRRAQDFSVEAMVEKYLELYGLKSAG